MIRFWQKVEMVEYPRATCTELLKEQGLSSRLDALKAEILLTELKYLDSWTGQRITNAEFLQK